MKKSLAFAAFALTAALASTAAMAEEEIYNISACTQDGRTVSTSMIVSMSNRPESEVRPVLDAMFAGVAARHSAEEFENTSMLYANQSREPLVQDMKAALAQVDHQYGIIAHSPLLPARTVSGCALK